MSPHVHQFFHDPDDPLDRCGCGTTERRPRCAECNTLDVTESDLTGDRYVCPACWDTMCDDLTAAGFHADDGDRG